MRSDRPCDAPRVGSPILLDRQHRRAGLFRAGRQIGDRTALPPFRNGFRVDAMALGQAPQALLTTLYRSTDRLSRRGAAVKNLAQSASLDAGEDSAPSKP